MLKVLRAEVLANNPRADGGQRVLLYSGNDTAAKAEVAALIDRIGFVGMDLGSPAVGGKLAQLPGGDAARLRPPSAPIRYILTRVVLDPEVPQDFCRSLIGDVCTRRIGCAGVLRDANGFDAGAG